MSGATAVIIRRSDGGQIQLAADERITSPVGTIRVDDVPRVLSEDGAWIEFLDTALDEAGEVWERGDPRHARIRLYSRGVVETYLLFDEAA